MMWITIPKQIKNYLSERSSTHLRKNTPRLCFYVCHPQNGGATTILILAFTHIRHPPLPLERSLQRQLLFRTSSSRLFPGISWTCPSFSWLYQGMFLCILFSAVIVFTDFFPHKATCCRQTPPCDDILQGCFLSLKVIYLVVPVC